MLDGKFNNFFDFFNLLVQASDHIISGIWYFFDLHKRHKRINFSRQDFMKDIIIWTDCYSQIGFDIFYFNRFVDVNDVFALVA